MACLATTCRQGLFVAVGTRCYRSQQFLCQFLLQQQQHQQQQQQLQNFNANTVSSAIANCCKFVLYGNTSASSSWNETAQVAVTVTAKAVKTISTATKHAISLSLPPSLSLYSPLSPLSSLRSSTLHYKLSKLNFHLLLLRNPTKHFAYKCTNRTYSTLMNCKIAYKTGNTKKKCCWTAYTHWRSYSSAHTQQPAGPVRDIQIDPYLILEDELKFIYDDIRQKLLTGTTQPELYEIASYYFDGQGKALRPMITILMAKAINYHLNKESSLLLHKQRQVAFFAEMAHSASLVHDDVIDLSDFRRNKPSVNILWNHKKVAMAGDFILSLASIIIARLNKKEVTILCSQIITDLVQGEFMQLGSRETENERFTHYLTKTYRKTASLMANTLKATAVLAEADEKLTEVAFQYGRNIGLAFQLVDDMLDFVSSTEAMGKPTAADLKLGLATAPVLFACEKFPELNPMIMRRFSEPGDVERAFELVHKSNGLEQTRFLARKHCIEAIRLAQQITESPYQKGLQVTADFVINRMK